jgi:hypothetical protein
MSALMENQYNYKAFLRDQSIISEQQHFTSIATTKDQLFQSLKATVTEYLADILHKIGIFSNMVVISKIIKHS